MKSIVSFIISIVLAATVYANAADKWSHVELAYADESKFDQVSASSKPDFELV